MISGFTWGALVAGQTNLGNSDAFVRKYDADGTAVWTRQFGSAFNDQPGGISVDASGVYVAGYTGGALPGQTNAGPAGSNDVFVRKYDAAGIEVWTRQFGTSVDDRGGTISVGASGVYVAGWTKGSLPGDPSGTDYDAFVRKYDADGYEAWTRQFGTASGDGANGVSADASGVYVTGVTGGTLPGQTSPGGSGLYVRNYDSNGTELWTQQFGTLCYDVASGISVDASGVYVAGLTDGTLPGQTSVGDRDGFLRKYDLGSVIASQDLNSITQVVIEGAHNVDDTITVDFDYGGEFSIQDGIVINGGSGVANDSLVIIGDGTSTGSYTPDAATFGNGVVTVGTTTIDFTDLEPVTASNLADLTFTTPAASTC